MANFLPANFPYSPSYGSAANPDPTQPAFLTNHRGCSQNRQPALYLSSGQPQLVPRFPDNAGMCMSDQYALSLQANGHLNNGVVNCPTNNVSPAVYGSTPGDCLQSYPTRAANPVAGMQPVGIDSNPLHLMDETKATCVEGLPGYQPSVDWASSMVADGKGVVNFSAPAKQNLSPIRSVASLRGGTFSKDSHHVSMLTQQVPTRCKRKAFDSLGCEGQPAVKIHVNEDRMASCMSDLHLDNNNLDWHPDLEEQQPWYRQQPREQAADRLSQVESLSNLRRTGRRFEYNENSTIELCRELEMGLKSKELLPKVIRDEMNKSSMQVMLWRPPGDSLSRLLNQSQGQKEGQTEGQSPGQSTDDSSSSKSSPSRENGRKKVLSDDTASCSTSGVAKLSAAGKAVCPDISDSSQLMFCDSMTPADISCGVCPAQQTSGGDSKYTDSVFYDADMEF